MPSRARRSLSAVLLMAAGTSLTQGQTISPPLIIDTPPGWGVSILSGTETHFGETSIAANPLNVDEVMFSAMMVIATTSSPIAYWNQVCWFVSQDGALTVANGGMFTSFSSGACTGNAETFDPTVTVDPESGHMWTGGLARFEEGTGLFAARRAPGATSISAPYVVVCGECIDKPLLAAGPQPQGDEGEVALYLGWQKDWKWSGSGLYCGAQTSAGSFRLSRPWHTPAFSDDPATLGNAATWQAEGRIYDPILNPPSSTYHATAEYFGRVVVPKVLPFGQVNQTSIRGRLVVAISDQHELEMPDPSNPPNTVPPGPWVNNEGRPYVVYSDDGGATWSSPVLIGYQATPAINVVYPLGWEKGSWPDLAFDPNDPTLVYVVFRALAPNSTTNWDLYVARSGDGGQSFPSQHIIHIGDDELGFGEGADQTLPAIAIDGCGGINLLFYTDANSPPNVSPKYIDAYYARLFDSTLFIDRLSAAAFPKATNTGFGVGHYVQIAAASDRVYPCYIERRLVNSTWTTQELHVRQIIVCREGDDSK
jgi:hypothetical protein